MFFVSLTYIKPLDVIDSHLKAHRDFLLRNYAAGAFLLSGRKELRTGGVILANSASREELEQILAEDPFRQLGLAQVLPNPGMPKVHG